MSEPTNIDGRPIEGRQSTIPVTVMNALLAAGYALGASEAHIGQVGGKTANATGSVTRPNNTTPYTAGDVWTSDPAAMITFTNAGRIAGGSGVIIGATCTDSANQATKLQLDLYLFAVGTLSVDADNAAWTPTDAELAPGASYLGLLQFNTWAVGDATSGAGGNAVSSASPTAPIAYVCGATTSLFGIAIPRNAYTPVANEVLSFALRCLQD